MDSRPTQKGTAAIRIALLAIALACLLGAGLLPGIGDAARAWSLFAGFTLLVPAVALSPRRSLAPIAVAVVFVVLGGLSALAAIPEPPEQAADRAKTLTKDQVKASQRSPEFESTSVDEQDAFAEAALLTALAGLAAIGGAILGAGHLGERRKEPAAQKRKPVAEPSPGRVEMAGRALVAVAFIGVLAALIRFLATQIPADDLHMAVKSFWNGGSYFLLLATFAIPGFGLWLQGALFRGASRRALIQICYWAILYLVLLIPTGQRGFVIALGLMVMVILLFDGRLRLRNFMALVVVGIALIGMSQALRNQVREDGEVSPSGLVSRLAPGEWRNLYGNQLASFNWTVQVVQFRDVLNIGNPFPQVLLKPIPRQIYPNKSQGFGSEFTRRVYPGADEQGISFAIPLVAETDYSLGSVGMVVVFLLLGLGVGLAELRIANRAPRAIKPIVLATIGWCAFVLVRGDLANALVFAAGWVIPLFLVSRSVGLRAGAPVRRVVIDALQVAPEFSGIGRRVAEIGRSLADADVAVPVAVKCGADVAATLRPEFPPGTEFHTPLRSSRPRWLRIAYQQLVAPFLDGASTVLVCPGDQAPVWGRAPLVFVVHDVRRLTHPKTSRHRLEAIYYNAVIRAGAKRARRIITISEFSKREIERTLSPSCPITVVSDHPEPAEPPIRPADGTCTFLTVGALRSYKGLETVIEALSRLPVNDGATPRVVCVGDDEGDGRYRDRLVSYAKDLKVDSSFELTGWISDDELHALYSSGIGTINPSTYEGYGLPVAESLAGGLPTIASDIPPHREIAAGAALYFAPGDAAELASLITQVATDPVLRADLAQRATERSQQLSESGVSWAQGILAAIPGATPTSAMPVSLGPAR